MRKSQSLFSALTGKEGVEGMGLENHLHHDGGPFVLVDDTWLCRLSVEKEGGDRGMEPGSGQDTSNSRLPLVMLKDNPRQAIGTLLDGQCFLAGIVSDRKALHIVFQDVWSRKHLKSNGSHPGMIARSSGAPHVFRNRQPP